MPGAGLFRRAVELSPDSNADSAVTEGNKVFRTHLLHKKNMKFSDLCRVFARH